MYFVFNLKDLVNELLSKPIWLRYATIRKIVSYKYPDITHYSNRKITDRLLEYARDFLDYKFVNGTEYLISERV